MKTKLIAGVCALALLIVFAADAQAMSSTNYRLEWYVPMTGSGGSASSTNYRAQFTVGQMASQPSASTNYHAGLGFWYGIRDFLLYLPVILR